MKKTRAKDYTEQPALMKGIRFDTFKQLGGLLPAAPHPDPQVPAEPVACCPFDCDAQDPTSAVPCEAGGGLVFEVPGLGVKMRAAKVTK